jgi:hypothetical protein
MSLEKTTRSSQSFRDCVGHSYALVGPAVRII